ncbi:polysaccharide deacetylase family protein [Kitasatospora sp. NPDC056783]|uniref:polysaccharide deacetylase family protein n=1 Tax=Kitasatospora sp. NPDC056783 TaxID=3345943 RepID=UPI0036CB0D52
MSPVPVVIGVNYHRVGTVDPADPFHRLHTVATRVFEAQLAWMLDHGTLVSPDRVRDAADLDAVNFVVCFDDVSVSALPHIRALVDAGLPVTVSPAGLLADRGNGHRDRVYAIERLVAPQAIAAHVRRVIPGRADEPFYYLTKAADLDPHWVRRELVAPLLDRIPDRAAPLLARRGYLSWQQLRPLARDQLVTVANHTWSHDNLEALPTPDLNREILDGDAAIRRHLGIAPRYLTLPFGHFSRQVALESLKCLSEHDYRGLLWVAKAGITVSGRDHAQALHLPRLRAATTIEEFPEQIGTAIRNATATLT